MDRSAGQVPNPTSPRSTLPGRLFRGALILLLAGFLAAPLALADSKPAEGEKTPTEGEAAKQEEEHHEPTALGHTMDDEAIHLFQSGRLPHEIRLWPEDWDTWFKLTRFKVLMVLSALIILAVYIPVARRVYSGEPPRGWWDNLFESVLTFLRDRVAKPNLGEEDADKYVPFLWALFLFILVNNLLGLFPFGGSATASISVTLALAVCVFFAIHGAAISKLGFGHYIGSLWPHIDIPIVLKVVIAPLVFLIEVMGILVRNAVLAVRLFANMFGGHMVMATILLFIYAAYKAGTHPALWATVTFSSVVGLVLLSLLELFVAFLQAFIFVFLTSLFMGLALHPHH